MQLIIRDTMNRLREIECSCIYIDHNGWNQAFIIYAKNNDKVEQLCGFDDPYIAEYVLNEICEYINTGKICYLKTEDMYRLEIKEIEKIFKE